MTKPPSGISALEFADAKLLRRLERRLEAGVRRSRTTGSPTLISLSTSAGAFGDPSATVALSRRPGERWFCLEQPDRQGSALAAIGCATKIEALGDDRFSQLATSWRALAASAIADAADGPPGSGLVAVGGFAFAADGGRSSHWEGFAGASLVVPELSLARRDDQVVLTINAAVAPDDTIPELLARLKRRLSEMRTGPLPLLDPAQTGAYRVLSVTNPSHYEDAVAGAIQRIQRSEVEKIVLARELEVQAPVAHDPAAVFGVLRETFPSCYVFAVGRGDATFVAASPELLVRREGQRASSVALAGSTRRSADPAVDDHLGERLRRSEKDREENAIVVRRIASALSPHAVWVTAGHEPTLIKVANIQHLATPIRAQLASSIDAIELAALLHPTPAVGGEPQEVAAELIPALEGMDRGWYAGPVGWTDRAGDGEFCVALRCALLRGREARLYAGCGIVRDSDPAAELAESELKLDALLPLLAG